MTSKKKMMLQIDFACERQRFERADSNIRLLDGETILRSNNYDPITIFFTPELAHP